MAVEGKCRRARLATAAICGLLLCAASGTAAGAQESPPANDPGSTCQDTTNAPAGCDTELTPVAKDYDRRVWTAYGGAEFGDPEGDLIAPQAPATVDFYTVRFKNLSLGFAGGAACPDDTPFDQLHDDYCGPSRAEGTPRVPVIYRYLDPDGEAGVEPGAWEEYYRGSDHGYVGSIAFLSPAGTDAIAVGGTGNYPRRELGRCEAGETPQTDPDHCHGGEPPTGETDAHYAARDLNGDEPNAAGRGRIWLYEDGGWDELAEEEEKQAQGEPMHGFTAIDCSARLQEGRRCLAGAYRQLWLWQGTEFARSFSDRSPIPDVDFPDRFRFRLRAIRFAPGSTTPADPIPQAIAITSGCCSDSKARNQPSVMGFFGSSVTTGTTSNTTSSPTVPEEARRIPVPEEAEAAKKHAADSFYSICMACAGVDDSLIASPGGPEPVPPGYEAPSELTTRLALGHQYSPVYDPFAGRARLPLPLGFRLVAGDGDAGESQDEWGLTPTPTAPDHLVDWAVGEQTSSGRGIAYTTLDGPAPLIDGLQCPPEVGNTFATDGSQALAFSKCEPSLEGAVAATTSKRVFKLPTYALNAFGFIPQMDTAWAVGDRGALLSLGGIGSAGDVNEASPPRLGSRQPGKLSDTSAYDSLNPVASGQAGEVPALASRKEQLLDEPRLIPGGVPDPTSPNDAPREDVDQIVMSRDGTEGWAVGTEDHLAMTMYHYEHGRWTRCETDSAPGVIEPDPACEALAPLRNADDGRSPIGIATAARVPLERDADPSNDDEFELLAIGARVATAGAPRPVLRYRDGRWSMDEVATKTLNLTTSRPTGIAISSPTDGWLVVHFASPDLYHFDGAAWTKCTGANRGVCGDQDEILPLSAAGGGTGSYPLRLSSSEGRVYLAGTRSVNSLVPTGYPMILVKEPGGSWSNHPSRGAYDPGCSPNPAGRGCVDSGAEDSQGSITGLSVARTADGAGVGWATAQLGGPADNLVAGALGSSGRKLAGTRPALLRLEPTSDGGSAWSPWLADGPEGTDRLSDPGDASADYAGSLAGADLVTTPGGLGDAEGWIVPRAKSFPKAPMLEFRDERWRAAPTPFSMIHRTGYGGGPQVVGATGLPQAAAPDGNGGLWLAVRQNGTALGAQNEQIAFYHYTDRAPEPVFSEAPHPIREEITAAAGGADGSFWVATGSAAVYRYDRVLGWDRVQVPGWDRGRTVTRQSEATAIAVGGGGEGLVVGEGGRIAELSPTGARLDEAAGAALCQLGAAGPCGTGRTLRAVAIAPTGEAMAGGDARALLWRSAGGGFRSIPPPPTTRSATITSIAYPQADTAFLTTDLGQVFTGNPSSPDPGWRIENKDPKEDQLETVDSSGSALGLRSIALDESLRGYAVGERGVVIERTGDLDEPWRRVDTGSLDDFYSVALPAGGGEGALIGGSNGVIYTLNDGRFEVARPADPWHPLTTAPVTEPLTARIVGLAMLPGPAAGGTEAWAVSAVPPARGRSPAPSAVLRYTSDAERPAIDPLSRAEALPDVPAGPAAVSLAAFGRSDCQDAGAQVCSEPQDSNLANDAIVREITEQIAARDRDAEEPVVATFTGDVALAAGSDDSAASTPAEANLMHRRWVELVASRFMEAHIPLFAAIGAGDLSQVKNCGNGCHGSQEAGVGTSGSWRDAMRDMAAPWGAEPRPSEDGVEYVPVESAAIAETPLSGARTHYALDVVSGGRKLVRMVFADNSMRSLRASEPNQDRIELGGQDQWLDQVLCRAGEAAGCSRGADEPAVVVANVPPYSYGAGALGSTATDAATFEQKLLEHDVTALISGRLGWNGLYYTCAPQLHTPQPGGEYPTTAPTNRGDCTEQAAGGSLPVETPDPTALLGDVDPAGALPSVIAASGGGRFGPDRQGQGSAAAGYWHGYTVVRIPADGDQAGVIVEQRPVFDWVSIRPTPGTGATHMVRASRKLALEGFGREVAGTDAPLRYDEITTAAITHRYDLLAADPDKPWLPQEADDDGVRTAASTRVGEADPCGPYLCLDPKVGSIDDQSGQVKAGKGNYPRTYAVALLSVGSHSATYPLVFEPRASFKPPTPPPARPAALPPPPLPPTQPPQPPPPTVEALVPPVLPNLTAAQPPAPPVPPTPPPAESQAPLDLSLSPTALDVTPPTAVSQPPTPPVNPAPPGGARKEARQRQAAAQKSGADSAEEGSEMQEMGGDLANDAPGASGSSGMTRHDFTALSSREQPSAWARDALIGGGIGIAALILALGLRTARPTPRRREPEVPAPAQSPAGGYRN